MPCIVGMVVVVVVVKPTPPSLSLRDSAEKRKLQPRSHMLLISASIF